MNSLSTDPVRSTPLWTTTASVQFAADPLAGDIDADVVVIGGGYTGLSAAYHLAKAGKSVALLERGCIAAGASGRNAAGWIPGWPGPGPDDVERVLGKEKGRRLNQMIADASREFPLFVEEHRLDPEFRKSGVAMCAPSAALAKRLHMIADQWRRFGISIDEVSPENVSALTGTSAFSDAAIYRNAGTLNPVNYCRGMASLAVGAGAGVYERSAVTEIARENGFWRVRSREGSVKARYAIAATGAYSDDPFVKLTASQYKIPLMVFASKPAPEIANMLMTGALPIASNHPLRLFWLMQDGAGRLVGSMLYPSNSNQSFTELASRFERHLKAYYPDMPLPEWDHAWSGYLDVVPGRVVQILELAPGLLAPLGYSGSGSIAAFGLGKELAKAIGHDDLESCAVPITRPPRICARRMIPWITRKIIAPVFG
ncbi:FAD-binding oxidoreductase [Parasphingopyxis algicola]|uniref:NAD(P)/FAD-dependent oxidoreductase n=1 Tax=Parasphingopyxis algicola TaxID=2026624 RepID=UPI0015A26B16|nr:FAD-dependent oxidoreductase [Parasphingopyxis algicola]QLC26441.1 FAD-binding oxidoreductase [Parasphingopyxis algicola]